MQLYEFLFRIDSVKINMKAIIENINDETLERIIQVLDENSISDIDLFRRLNVCTEDTSQITSEGVEQEQFNKIFIFILKVL